MTFISLYVCFTTLVNFVDNVCCVISYLCHQFYTVSTGFRYVSESVRNFPSAAVSAATFGERPRQAADAAHLLLLAGSQRRCSDDRAGALKVCLRSVEIFDWKD